jgi:hypothetical protein
VEEGVDGVEQAPEDVSDGASAHDRAPLHHAAVLYERHLRRFVQQAVHSREPDNLQLQLAHYYSPFFTKVRAISPVMKLDRCRPRRERP